jgi:hypothetical protein
MVRARDIGIRIGSLPTGPTNSVLDVTGVGIGHATVVRDEPPPPQGRGSARTGVTTLLLAEDSYRRPLAAGGAVLNGAGECTGFLTAQEWGSAETPVYLTSTMQPGRVYDAACEIELDRDPGARPGRPQRPGARPALRGRRRGRRGVGPQLDVRRTDHRRPRRQQQPVWRRGRARPAGPHASAARRTPARRATRDARPRPRTGRTDRARSAATPARAGRTRRRPSPGGW